MHEVTVLIPAKNEGNFIEQTVSSVLNQTHKNLQVIVSDNYSTDNTFNIVDRIAKIDKRLVCIKPSSELDGFTHHKFLIDYFNKERSNSYSMILGGHDLLSRTLIEDLVKEMGDPSSQLVYTTNAYEIDEHNIITRKWPSPFISQFRNPVLDPILVLLSTYYNIPFFGLWGASLRSMVTLGASCTGSDHLYIARAATKTNVKGVPVGNLYLRRTPSTNQQYIEKHFSQSFDYANAENDLKNQLRIVCDVVESCSPPNSGSRFVTDFSKAVCLIYLYRYIHHFSAVGLGHDGFLQEPRAFVERLTNDT